MNILRLSIQCDTYYKIARKAEDLAVLKSNVGKYVHFSNSDRFGISFHKDIHPGNPRAVYGFPLTSGKYTRIEENKPDAFYDYGYNKYIYIFDVTGNILNMDDVNLDELSNKVREFVNKTLKRSSYHTMYNSTPHPYSKDGARFLRWLGDIAKDLFKNEHSGINVLLRGIGYDAIETRDYGFGDDLASEIAVLNPNAVNLIAKVNNPMLTKEQIAEIDYYQSPEYQLEQDKKEKARKEKDEAIQARINKYKQYNEEEEQVYQTERKLIKEHKFDEAKQIREVHKNKWKDFLSQSAI